MTNDNGESEEGRSAIQPWMALWDAWVQQSRENLQAMAACAPPTVDLATLRKQWLTTIGRSVDEYLRTPTFLEAMRKNFDAVTTLKSASEFAQREMARESGLPHIEDISGLFMRLETANDGIVAKLGAIERRLVRLEEELRDRNTSHNGGS